MRAEIIEKLAAIEHQRWADWQRWVHDCCADIWFESAKNGDEVLPTRHGGLVIPPELVERWERQIHTPYADLSESEKQSDREQVMRYWPLIVEFVAAWIADYHDAVMRDHLAEQWREEMGDGERG